MTVRHLLWTPSRTACGVPLVTGLEITDGHVVNAVPLQQVTDDLLAVTCKRCQTSAVYFNQTLRQMAAEQGQ